MTHTEMTEMASGSHRLCFVLGLHSEALPSSWGFQWYNVKARSTEVGFEEGIKEEKCSAQRRRWKITPRWERERMDTHPDKHAPTEIV